MAAAEGCLAATDRGTAGSLAAPRVRSAAGGSSSGPDGPADPDDSSRRRRGGALALRHSQCALSAGAASARTQARTCASVMACRVAPPRRRPRAPGQAAPACRAEAVERMTDNVRGLPNRQRPLRSRSTEVQNSFASCFSPHTCPAVPAIASVCAAQVQERCAVDQHGERRVAHYDLTLAAADVSLRNAPAASAWVERVARARSRRGEQAGAGRSCKWGQRSGGASWPGAARKRDGGATHAPACDYGGYGAGAVGRRAGRPLAHVRACSRAIGGVPCPPRACWAHAGLCSVGISPGPAHRPRPSAVLTAPAAPPGYGKPQAHGHESAEPGAASRHVVTGACASMITVLFG